MTDSSASSTPMNPPKSAIKYDASAHGARCDLCPLRGNPVVPPTRVDNPALVIVGEGPGRVEEKMGAPFMGASGKFLDERLRKDAKIPRSACHITNAALCRGESDDDNERAAECCAPRLLNELSTLPSEAPILCLGKAATSSVLGVRNILSSRGFIWAAPEIAKATISAGYKKDILKGDSLKLRAALAGRVVLPSLHPAFILRADTWKPVSEIDFRRVGRVVRGESKMTEDLCDYVIGGPELLARLGPVVSCDIETTGIDPMTCDILSIGLNDGVHGVQLWPWTDDWAREFSAAMKTKASVVFHNGVAYDLLVMQQHGVTIPASIAHDTLLAMHAFASHLPKSLSQAASTYTDARPWKKIFKGGSDTEKGTTPDKLDGDTLNLYNAADARLTYLAWMRMQGDLQPERRTYDHDRALSTVTREMQRVGIAVDTARKVELSEALAERREILQEKMRHILGDSLFNPAKLDDVRRALFQRLGASYVKVTPKGQASTANETLEGLRMGGNERHAAFATALLTWRLAGKIKSTYLDALDVKPSGRTHFNWKAFGTISGRLSCRFQSVPRYKKGNPEDRVREIYIPAAGNEFVYYDVSQAEMRLAAYLSGDPVFMRACEGDVHANNAKAVFPEAAARGLLDGEAKKIPVKEGGGKDFRDIAKNLGFAISYCAEAEKVYITLRSKGFNVSFQQVQLILDKLHAAYKVYYRWVDKNLAVVRRCGSMRSPFLGRIRWLGWYPKITDVANFPIQSGLADIVNERAIELSKNPLFSSSLVAQVHDACIYDVPRQMVGPAKTFINNLWAKPIDTFGGSLILPIDLKSSNRWSEL